MKRLRLASGFTLIEILVVLFIISIVASVVLLTLGRNENHRLESFANELAQVVTLAEEQAMLQPAVLGLSLKGNSLQFSTFKSVAGEKTSTWQPVHDDLLNQHTIPSDIQIEVVVSHNEAKRADNENMPQIIFSTNGDVTPFTIYVGKKGEKPRYAIKGDANGSITNKVLP